MGQRLSQDDDEDLKQAAHGLPGVFERTKLWIFSGCEAARAAPAHLRRGAGQPGLRYWLAARAGISSSTREAKREKRSPE